MQRLVHVPRRAPHPGPPHDAIAELEQLLQHLLEHQVQQQDTLDHLSRTLDAIAGKIAGWEYQGQFVSIPSLVVSDTTRFIVTPLAHPCKDLLIINNGPSTVNLKVPGNNPNAFPLGSTGQLNPSDRTLSIPDFATQLAAGGSATTLIVLGAY